MSRQRKYTMNPIPSKFSEKGGYSARFVGDGYSIDACKEILPGVIKDTGILIGEGAAWDLFKTFLQRCVLRVAETGETVTLGSLLSIGMTIQGWFANKDSKASKENVCISAKLLKELKPSVAFSMSNDIDGFTLTIYTVMGDGCALGHVKPAAAFRINGKYLQLLEGDKVVASAKDAEGETVEAECAVIESDEDHVDALLPAAFGAAALAGRELTLTVHGRCGDADAGTQTKSISAAIDEGGITAPVIAYAYSAGHEGDRTHIHCDEANALRIVGENLAGATVKLIYIDSDGDMEIDIPGDKVTAEKNGIAIDGDWLAETLPSDLSADVTFTVATAEGEASVTLKHD